MTSRMTKMRPSRNNTSRKKSNRAAYSESMVMPLALFKSFVGPKDNISTLLTGYKVSLDFSLSEDKKSVVLSVTAKHRNHLEVIMTRLVDRYNKLVTITNSLIAAVHTE